LKHENFTVIGRRESGQVQLLQAKRGPKSGRRHTNNKQRILLTGFLGFGAFWKENSDVVLTGSIGEAQQIL
jgi:hypothetical protein